MMIFSINHFQNKLRRAAHEKTESSSFLISPIENLEWCKTQFGVGFIGIAGAAHPAVTMATPAFRSHGHSQVTWSLNSGLLPSHSNWSFIVLAAPR